MPDVDSFVPGECDEGAGLRAAVLVPRREVTPSSPAPRWSGRLAYRDSVRRDDVPARRNVARQLMNIIRGTS